MIDRKSIIAWSEQFPWAEPSMVEQDLLISRALVAIFSNEFLASQLAFRGGTALHKLYMSPQPRYSEDIDLVQINPGPIKPIMFKLGEVLSFLPDRLIRSFIRPSLIRWKGKEIKQFHKLSPYLAKTLNLS